MCGIAGFCNLDGAPADRDTARLMAEALRHRGPDGLDAYAEGACALEHARLAILDLTDAAAQRIPADGRINWAQSQNQIYNWIRAQSHPYPGAFTMFNNTSVHVWRAEKVADRKPYFGIPGQIVSFEDSAALVLCGDQHLIKITDTSIADKPESPRSLFRSIAGRLS